MIHDGPGPLVGFRAKAGGHQRVGQRPLVFVHFPEQETMTVQRRVIPKKALSIYVIEGYLHLLVRR